MFKKNNSGWIDGGNLVESILNGNSDRYNLSLNNIQEIYFNDMTEPTIESLMSSHENGLYMGVNHKHNKYGYRGPEPKSNNDILALGCSQTFGVGIRETENTWPGILSKSLNLNYVNLAKSGSSINSQVRRAFAYFKKFGHPKYIFAVFPDFQRMEFVSNYRTLIDNKDWPLSTPGGIKVKHLKGLQDIPKISVMPHDSRDIFTEEMCYFVSAQYILMLEQYCDAVGIKFVWGTWSEKDEELIVKLKEINTSSYKNFVRLYSYKWRINFDTMEEEFYDQSSMNFIPEKSNCHADYSNLDDFHISLDKISNPSSPHSGVHKHLHWAEIIKDNLIKNNWMPV